MRARESHANLLLDVFESTKQQNKTRSALFAFSRGFVVKSYAFLVEVVSEGGGLIGPDSVNDYSEVGWRMSHDRSMHLRGSLSSAVGSMWLMHSIPRGKLHSSQ